MTTLGLTGGIGSGKSAASQLFKQLGVPVIDADNVAREVVAPGQPALNSIADFFGAKSINADGTLNRRWLRQQVFDSPEKRQWLEQLLHPLIRQHIISWLSEQTSPYCILTSPLLLETDQHQLVDQIIVVDLPETLQLERTCQRDQLSESEAKKIITTQIKRSERVESADYILDNSGDLRQLEHQVLALDAQLKQYALQSTATQRSKTR